MKNKIITNGTFFAAYKLLNVLFPLISSVYVARVLLASGTGKVAYAQNIVTYFTLIAALGLPTYGTREIAKSLGNKEQYYKTFSELFVINAISTTLCVIAYYGMCFVVPGFQVERELYMVAGLSIVLNYFNIDWLYQGREEYQYISVRGAIIKLLSVLLMFVFVKKAEDYVIYAGIHCFVLGGNNLINILGLRKRVRLLFNKMNMRRHIKPLLILFATNIAIEIYTLLDTTMLGATCSDEIVGYYSYAMRTSKIVITILVAATTVLLPKLSSYFQREDKTAYKNLISKGLLFTIATSVPCSALLCIHADTVIQILYGADFQGAVTALRVLSLLIIPITLSTFLGVQVLCSANMEKKMLVAVSAGAIINIVLNTILIKNYQHNGAAVASILSEIVVALIEIVFVKKAMDIGLDKRMCISIALSAAIAIAVVCLLKYAISSMWLGLILSSISGVVIYVIINMLTIMQNRQSKAGEDVG